MARGNPNLNDFPDSERCKGKNAKTGNQCRQKKQNYCDFCLAHDPSEQAQIKRTKRAGLALAGRRLKSRAKNVRQKAARQIIRVANESAAVLDENLQNDQIPSSIDQVIAFQADLLFRGYEIIENSKHAHLDDILSLLRATAPITKALELKEKLKAKDGGKMIHTLQVLTKMDDDDEDDDQTIIVINDPDTEKKLGNDSNEDSKDDDDDYGDDD